MNVSTHLRHHLVLLAAIWIGLPFLTGCGEKKAFDVNLNPEIVVKTNGGLLPAGLTIVIGNVEKGEKIVGATLDISNRGDGELIISGFALNSNPPGALSLTTESVSALPTQDSPWVIAPTIDGEAAEGRQIQITFERQDDAVVTGTLTIYSNSTLAKTSQASFPIEVIDLAPSILLQPEVLDFGNVIKGEEKTLELTIRNMGTDPLEISEIELSSPNAYALKLGAQELQGQPEGRSLTLDPPVMIAPGQTYPDKLQVVFSPDGPDPMPGELRVVSNDPDITDGSLIPIRGNMTGACFTLNPASLNFGGYPLDKEKVFEVDIYSCGTATLLIETIEIVATAPYSNEFSLDLSTIGSIPADTSELTTSDPPIILEVGEKASFKAIYKPVDISLFSGDAPVPDLGKIRFGTNTFVPERELHLQGHGIELTCPFAKIQVIEGDEVVPQTSLHLLGEASYAALGDIDSYQWRGSVKYAWQTEDEEPIELSPSLFAQSDTIPNPTIEVNAAGVYTFELDVWDAYGTKSCIPDTVSVEVRPDDALHVELLWNTPGDPDQTDDTGGDLDLHFLHPIATQLAPKDYDGDGENDGWFMNQWDCFWFTNTQGCSWDEPGESDDDPSLDRDDKDGLGPENLNLKAPTSGNVYRVGVHHWVTPDVDFGPSDATIAIYLDGNPVYQATLEGLLPGQLWDVCTISWDGETGVVAPVVDAEGAPKVFPSYPIPPAIPVD